MKRFLYSLGVFFVMLMLVLTVSCNGANKTPDQSGTVGGDGESASDAEVAAAIKEVLACTNAFTSFEYSSDMTAEYQTLSMSRSIPDGMNLTSIFQKLMTEDADFRSKYTAGMDSFYPPESNTEPVSIQTEYGIFVLDMDPPVEGESNLSIALSNFTISIGDVLRIELPSGRSWWDYDSGSSVEEYVVRYFDTRRYDGCYVGFHSVITTKYGPDETVLEFSVEISDLKYKGSPREVTPYIQTEVEQFIKDGYVE